MPSPPPPDPNPHDEPSSSSPTLTQTRITPRRMPRGGIFFLPMHCETRKIMKLGEQRIKDRGSRWETVPDYFWDGMEDMYVMSKHADATHTPTPAMVRARAAFRQARKYRPQQLLNEWLYGNASYSHWTTVSPRNHVTPHDLDHVHGNSPPIPQPPEIPYVATTGHVPLNKKSYWEHDDRISPHEQLTQRATLRLPAIILPPPRNHPILMNSPRPPNHDPLLQDHLRENGKSRSPRVAAPRKT